MNEAHHPISPREKEVLGLLLEGKINKQIALSLGISESTVEFHLKNIYAKHGVNSRIELVLKLGKSTGVDLGESIVETGDKRVENGNQPIPQIRWNTSLRDTVRVIKKEIAMTVRIILRDIGSYFLEHPLLLGLTALIAAGFATNVLIYDVGLYFWASYILWGLALGSGGFAFGWSWKKIKAREIHPRPIVIIGIALLPFTIVLVDLILLQTIARNMGQVSISMPGIYNKAEWLVAPDGKSYLSVWRTITHDRLLFFAVFYALTMAGIGYLFGARFGNKQNSSI